MTKSDLDLLVIRTSANLYCLITNTHKDIYQITTLHKDNNISTKGYELDEIEGYIDEGSWTVVCNLKDIGDSLREQASW